MGVSAGGSADLDEALVTELRRIAADLLGNVSSYADDMLDFISSACRRPAPTTIFAG